MTFYLECKVMMFTMSSTNPKMIEHLLMVLLINVAAWHIVPSYILVGLL